MHTAEVNNAEPPRPAGDRRTGEFPFGADGEAMERMDGAGAPGRPARAGRTTTGRAEISAPRRRPAGSNEGKSA